MLLLRGHATALRATRALATTTKPWFRAAGEGTLILRFGNGIDEATNKKVLRRLDALGQKPRGVTDAVPAYASLAVHYDCTEISGDEVKAWVAEAASRDSFMRSHGVALLGTSIAEAWVMAYYLKKSCATQIALMQIVLQRQSHVLIPHPHLGAVGIHR